MYAFSETKKWQRYTDDNQFNHTRSCASLLCIVHQQLCLLSLYRVEYMGWLG